MIHLLVVVLPSAAAAAEEAVEAEAKPRVSPRNCCRHYLWQQGRDIARGADVAFKTASPSFSACALSLDTSSRYAYR